MHAAHSSSIYDDAQSGLRTPKQDEYRVFARITHRLSEASSRNGGSFPDLAAALHDNQRLWAALASDVSLPTNPLPKDLRARIFYLAEFTRDHSRRVLNGDADATALVEINTAVMRGLRHVRGAS